MKELLMIRKKGVDRGGCIPCAGAIQEKTFTGENKKSQLGFCSQMLHGKSSKKEQVSFYRLRYVAKHFCMGSFKMSIKN